MLELYHGGPGANSLKALIPLKEKKLEFESHFINLLRFEQHDPAFVKINPNGQVPVLIHDGRVLTESTVINEYVDTVFPRTPLRPADPYERARMRIWTKFVDEYFCPALSFIGWHSIIQPAVKDISEEEFETLVQRIPLKEQQDKWRESAKRVWTEEQLEDWRRRVRVSVKRMEDQLAASGGPYLLGKAYTLADVSCFAMAAPMPGRPDSVMSDAVSPRCMAWHHAMSERPAVKEVMAMRRSAARAAA